MNEFLWIPNGGAVGVEVDVVGVGDEVALPPPSQQTPVSQPDDDAEFLQSFPKSTREGGTIESTYLIAFQSLGFNRSRG